MHILIIQSPDFSRDFEAISHQAFRVTPFAPADEILRMMGFLRAKTSHTFELLDLRLHDEVENELSRQFNQSRSIDAVLLYGETNTIGFTTGTLEFVKRHAPETPSILYGPLPTAFLSRCMELPGVQFAISGDPERPVHLLLDSLDLPARWSKIPGLAFHDHLPSAPYWETGTFREAEPALNNVFWPAYRREFLPESRRHAGLRLTRGHTGLPCDMDQEIQSTPFREYNLDQMANALSKCVNQEIDCVKCIDPPGAWTPDRIGKWCRALTKAHNSQPWGFTLLPSWFSPEQAEDLFTSGCRVIHFRFPASRKEDLEQFGCVLDPAHIQDGCEVLQNAGIQTLLHFQLRGPFAGSNEVQTILPWLDHRGPADFALTPSPLAIASPLYQKMMPRNRQTHLDQRIRWARAPWMETRPLPVWGGNESIDSIIKTRDKLIREAKGGLKKRFKHQLSTALSQNPIKTLEEKAMHWLPTILPGHKPS